MRKALFCLWLGGGLLGVPLALAKFDWTDWV
jgi:hypothetical protein